MLEIRTNTIEELSPIHLVEPDTDAADLTEEQTEVLLAQTLAQTKNPEIARGVLDLAKAHIEERERVEFELTKTTAAMRDPALALGVLTMAATYQLAESYKAGGHGSLVTEAGMQPEGKLLLSPEIIYQGFQRVGETQISVNAVHDIFRLDLLLGNRVEITSYGLSAMHDSTTGERSIYEERTMRA